MTNYEHYFGNRIEATHCNYCFLREKCPKSDDMPCEEWVRIWLNEVAEEDNDA